MSDTFTLNVEYTDTFAGEANYSWVRRESLELPTGLSSRTIMRRAKNAMGLSGVKGKSFSYGDSWEFRPYGSCTVMFAMVQY
jgi:hypothetical protein